MFVSDDKTGKPLRSGGSYGKLDRDGSIRRSHMKSQRLPDDVFNGRPVIGICNTGSEITPTKTGLRDIVEQMKRGVWEAGGLPLEFPTLSLGEAQRGPTAMLFRKLLAMDVEESIRGNPIDDVVLPGGCDKTTPGPLMSAANVDLPTNGVSSGPRLNGKVRGEAVVFETIDDFRARIDDSDLDVDAASILVLKGCGPKGYPGMSEDGNMPLPTKLLEKGVKDMLRISDARMSGTVILHASPGSDAGRPLAIVRNGELITLDGPNRTLNIAISDEVMEIQFAAWRADPPPSRATCGYAKLHIDRLLGAGKGADLDFLVGSSGSVVTRERP